jgi:cilia- and flagella-associated protein 52
MFPQGINNISLLLNGDIMIGAGDGSIAKINMSNFKIKACNQVLGGVTSLSLTADSTHMFVGTSQSNIYWCDTDKLVPELRSTCHNSKINHIAFPYNYSDVFATCSFQEIRIWNAKSRQELLRIQVPNLDCFSVQFMEDGKSILSGWSDGKIRSFFPQSGKLMYVINDAHTHGVTALITSHDSQKIVSGGMEGEIRVWKVGKQTQTMEASLKEHRGRVNDIQITIENDKAVSASSDGSCIIWDLKSFTRVICLFEPTMFKQVLFFPDQTQLLTTGSDKKISYWDNFDGQTIRSIDGADDGEINCLAIQNEGIFFASGGEDKLIRMWKYDEGLCYYVGEGHSGAVSRVMN